MDPSSQEIRLAWEVCAEGFVCGDCNLGLTGKNKITKKPTKFLKSQTWLTNACDSLNPKQVYSPYPLQILAWKQ